MRSNSTRSSDPQLALVPNAALAMWALPWLGVCISFAASAAAGYVPACMPFIEGCTSVSATGRHGLGYVVFKAAMFPAAALALWYWPAVARWTRAAHGRSSRVDRLVFALGIVGALALMLYTTFLGSEGDIYRAMRRYGTATYFACTFVAELLFTLRARSAVPESRIVLAKTLLCFGMIGLGTVLGLATYVLEDKDELQNATEWWSAAALTACPLLTWLMWQDRNTTLWLRNGRSDDAAAGGYKERRTSSTNTSDTSDS